MQSKKAIGWTVSGLILLLLLWALVGVISVTSEAGSMDSMLKVALKNHESIASLTPELAAKGFQMQPNSAQEIAGNGPVHWVVLYKVWLTLSVQSGSDRKVHGYDLNHGGAFL